MRAPGAVTAVAVVGLVLAIAASPAAAQEFRTTWRGSWHCNDRGDVYPLAGARVELWQRGYSELPKWLTDSLVAVKHTDAGGAYEFTTVSDSEDDFYIRIVLDDNEAVRLEDWLPTWAWFADTRTNQNDVPVQDFGALAIRETGGGTPECAIWQGGREAYADYRSIMGRRPRYGRLLIEANAPSSGVPYALYTTIMWPSNYRPGPISPAGVTSRRTVFHEFGHTVRHALDGSAAHFFQDVGLHNYLQQHQVCKRTNHAFAFNEGWAEYWAHEFVRIRNPNPRPGGEGWIWQPNPMCASPPNDYAVEGNVAAALGRLEELCENIDKRAMVEVLSRAANRIHSFQEFVLVLERHTGKCDPTRADLVPYTAQRPPKVPPIAVRRGALAILGELRRSENLARKQRKVVTGTLVVCRKEPCPEQPSGLARASLPPILKADVQVTSLLRKRLAFTASFRATRRLLGTAPGRRMNRALARLERGIARDIAALEAPALRGALRSAGPMLRSEDTTESRLLARRLAEYARTFRRGRLPSAYRAPGLTAATVDPLPAPAGRRR